MPVLKENGSCVRLSDLLFSIFLCGWIKYEASSWPIKLRLWHHKDGSFNGSFEPYQKERIRVFLSDNVTLPMQDGTNFKHKYGRVGRIYAVKAICKARKICSAFLPRTVAPTGFYLCNCRRNGLYRKHLHSTILYALLGAACELHGVRQMNSNGSHILTPCCFAIYL